MSSLSRLAAVDCLANACGATITDHGLRMLAWADCLLRADRPSMKRVEACIAALEAEFGLQDV